MMMLINKICQVGAVFGGVLFMLVLPMIAHAQPFADCQKMFAMGQPPAYSQDKLTVQTVPLCFSGFAVMYSGVARTPLWSAEYLDRRRLTAAGKLERRDNFHAESRLPINKQATLADYKGSGYDRGHMAPNADMATLTQQYESFSLANITPQTPELNRYVWRDVESHTRYLTQKHGSAYVVTGVGYATANLTQINGRVLVPSHLFKAVYVPELNQAAAYYASNDASGRVVVVSLDELAMLTGIDAMPALDKSVKAQAMLLSLPNQQSDAQHDDMTAQDAPWWVIVITKVVRWLLHQLG